MSSHVLLNLLNELRRKEIKCKACQAFYHLFGNEFNKFNNTGAQMLDSIYHMTLKFLENHIFGVKRQDLAIFYTMLQWTSLPNITKSVNH